MWPIGQYLDVKAAGGVHYHSYSVRCAVHTKTQKTETIRGPRRYSSDLWLWSTGQKLEHGIDVLGFPTDSASQVIHVS